MNSGFVYKCQTYLNGLGVPGHSDIPRNCGTDELARLGTTIQLQDAMAGILLGICCNCQCHNESGQQQMDDFGHGQTSKKHAQQVDWGPCLALKNLRIISTEAAGLRKWEKPSAWSLQPQAT